MLASCSEPELASLEICEQASETTLQLQCKLPNLALLAIEKKRTLDHQTPVSLPGVSGVVLVSVERALNRDQDTCVLIRKQVVIRTPAAQNDRAAGVEEQPKPVRQNETIST